MMRGTLRCLAKISGIPWEAGAKYRRGAVADVGDSTKFAFHKRQSGFLDAGKLGVREHKLRAALNEFVPAPAGTRHSALPGVEHASDLPADPITRLFFQAKGSHALYQGTYDNPSNADPDRVQLTRRSNPRRLATTLLHSPTYDFCHRLREASEQRKRFVIVPSTPDTRGAALVLQQHGLIAGFRDFHNDRAFAVELKYFQGDPVLDAIEPASIDEKVEFDWSPKMVRRLTKSYGITNKIRIFILRTWDGRIIDHLQAAKESIGGRGLLVAS